MNAHLAMQRAVGLVLGSSSIRSRALAAASQQQQLQALHMPRPFRTTTVQMGRRAAKIANRKVCMRGWLGAHSLQAVSDGRTRVVVASLTAS